MKPVPSAKHKHRSFRPSLSEVVHRSASSLMASKSMTALFQSTMGFQAIDCCR